MKYTKEQIEWINNRIVVDKDGNYIVGMCEYLADADSLESDYREEFGNELEMSDDMYNYYFDSVNCECSSEDTITQEEFDKYKKLFINEDTNPIIEETLKSKVEKE